MKQRVAIVGEAKGSTTEFFLGHLTAEQAAAIRRAFGVGPGMFWRAAKGKSFLALPQEYTQRELEFGE